jgi:hypothetical protein
MGIYGAMTCRRVCLPEHDLTLQLVGGLHGAEEAIRFFRSLDSTCATRWLSYFDPTSDLSQIDVASVPLIKHAYADKQTELFGDKPKPHVIVCRSDSSRQYLLDFLKMYFGHGGDENLMSCFCSLEEAYACLGLSDEARLAVARAIRGFEAAAAEAGRKGAAPVSGRMDAPARLQGRQ